MAELTGKYLLGLPKFEFQKRIPVQYFTCTGYAVSIHICTIGIFFQVLHVYTSYMSSSPAEQQNGEIFTCQNS